MNGTREARRLRGAGATPLARGALLAILASCGPTEPSGPRVTSDPGLVWSLAATPSNTIPGSSPDGSIAYYIDVAHQVTAVRSATGKVAWSAKTDPEAAETTGWEIRSATGVAVVGDVDVYGFDEVTGRRLWKFQRLQGEEGVRGMGVSGNTLVLAGRDGTVSALDVRTGGLLWQTNVSRPDTAVFLVHASAAGSMAFAAGRWSTKEGLSRGLLFAFELGTGRLRWVQPLSPEFPNQFSGASGPAVLASGVVAISQEDGRIIGLDPIDGHVRWIAPRVHDIASFGPNDIRHLSTDGTDVLATSNTGTIALVDGATGAERWRMNGVASTPLREGVLTSDAAYVAHFHQLIAYRRTDGAVLWRRGGGGSERYIGGPRAATTAILLANRLDRFEAIRIP